LAADAEPTETGPEGPAPSTRASNAEELPVIGRWVARLLAHPVVQRILGSWVGRVGAKTLEEIAKIEIFDRAMTLAAQAFTSIFPVIILLATLRPGEEASTTLASYLGLTPEASQVMQQAIPSNPDVVGGFGLLGLLVVLLSATSFSRALARMYGRVWAAKTVGLRGAWRWLAVIIAVALSITVIHALHNLVADVRHESFADAGVVFVVQAALWTWVPWTLLSARVPVRLLLPGGVLIGVAEILLNGVGHIYVPLALNTAAREFGSLGVAFTYISWLFVLSFALVLLTVLGAVIVRDDGWFGRLLRGSAPLPEGTGDGP